MKATKWTIKQIEPMQIRVNESNWKNYKKREDKIALNALICEMLTAHGIGTIAAGRKKQH